MLFDAAVTMELLLRRYILPLLPGGCRRPGAAEAIPSAIELLAFHAPRVRLLVPARFAETPPSVAVIPLGRWRRWPAFPGGRRIMVRCDVLAARSAKLPPIAVSIPLHSRRGLAGRAAVSKLLRLARYVCTSTEALSLFGRTRCAAPRIGSQRISPLQRALLITTLLITERHALRRIRLAMRKESLVADRARRVRHSPVGES